MYSVTRDRRVFLFPGQGSQHVGMGTDLYASSPRVRRMVDRASEVTGLDLPRLMVEGCEQELADPAVAQVSVYTLSVATASLLSDAGCEPWAVAGHSLGEYGALVVAGCLDWEIALRFVARRGRCMARAGREKPGAMAAILGLPPETVEKLCDRTADGEEVGLATTTLLPRSSWLAAPTPSAT